MCSANGPYVRRTRYWKKFLSAHNIYMSTLSIYATVNDPTWMIVLRELLLIHSEKRIPKLTAL